MLPKHNSFNRADNPFSIKANVSGKESMEITTVCRYLLEQNITGKPSLLTCFHPVPTAFSNRLH